MKVMVKQILVCFLCPTDYVYTRLYAAKPRHDALEAAGSQGRGFAAWPRLAKAAWVAAAKGSPRGRGTHGRGHVRTTINIEILDFH